MSQDKDKCPYYKYKKKCIEGLKVGAFEGKCIYCGRDMTKPTTQESQELEKLVKILYQKLTTEDIALIDKLVSQRTRQECAEELKNKAPDLIEKYFPKGECKERGQAMVLIAIAIGEISKWTKEE